MLFGLPVIDHRTVPVMTVDHAHQVMQTHIECPSVACPIKRQARARLVEAHRMVPGIREFSEY
ncbi:hypothetical protein NLM24_28870 [Nocardia zapadnayensis]|uniref:hypothetical protein n=1 Tax=Nocardia rhamnosiphila TaxID=426716 RepID=UPI00224686B9|nr:hypothetical protein [Nocardia zapadnayensis]MCX0274631.1 hypothetical protein [Nocardia zapadnayensis]